jgi:REP-associated tyrosine transposase
VGREHRAQIAGGISHVYTRGNRRELIYRVDYDYDLFLMRLGDEIAKRGWNCLAYALLPNHYHLVFETPEANLSIGMHRLNLRWAKAFNREYGLLGHVFQSRFGSRQVGDQRDLEGVLRYVLRNPVNAGLCREPADWLWSSYAELMGAAAPRWIVSLERLAELLGSSMAELPARLTRLVS